MKTTKLETLVKETKGDLQHLGIKEKVKLEKPEPQEQEKTPPPPAEEKKHGK